MKQQPKSDLFIDIGMLAMRCAVLETAHHSHLTYQLTVPTSASTLFIEGERQPLTGIQLLAPGIEHRLDMAVGWVVLIEPLSTLGQHCESLLNGASSAAVTLSQLAHPDHLPSDQDDIPDFIMPWFTPQLRESHSANIDQRIADLLTQLNACFSQPNPKSKKQFLQQCLKPAQWRANEVASQLAISESRFLHLFKQETGVAWRAYLLWRRLLCAILAMRPQPEGNPKSLNATQAAHLAGFADSAHLSRTFKSTFGITIRQALALL
ncbi:helix-turn-helix transcriptional regulator [Thaumasiovibrio subtropicus]|uniref:helix-turn-helix transcriptional regulator n=1 Tax=Thaumasiovibrio subtropicus TaxID=1891207 RepID=UPI000D3609E1|nr:helix-turn-helix transcriptional regulator [Thaumasiovibrio subtropicus]